MTHNVVFSKIMTHNVVFSKIMTHNVVFSKIMTHNLCGLKCLYVANTCCFMMGVDLAISNVCIHNIQVSFAVTVATAARRCTWFRLRCLCLCFRVVSSQTGTEQLSRSGDGRVRHAHGPVEGTDGRSSRTGAPGTT